MHTQRVPILNLGLLFLGLVLYVYSLTTYAEAAQATSRTSSPNQVTNTVAKGASTSFAQTYNTKSSLPVTANRFVVDKGVSEIEILVTTDNFKSVQVVTPQGKEYIPFQQNNENVTWQKIEKLYAIKIKGPEAGLWQVQGNLLSYPEVIVESSLEFITPQFPNNLLRGETLALSAFLQEDGKKITTGDILNSTQITATLQNVATSELYKIFLTQDEHNHNKSYQGVFHYDYHLETVPGVYRLNISAVGLLFQRERQQQFYVHDYPAVVSTDVKAENDQIVVSANVTSPLLDMATCQLSANILSIDGSTQNFMLDKIDNNHWQMTLPVDQDFSKIDVVLAGYLKDSRPVHVVFPKANLEILYQQAYLQLEQNNLMKSNQAWQRLQQQQIARLLPFSHEKLTDNLAAENSPIEEISLKPLPQYSSFMQDLLVTWQPYLFGAKEDDAQEETSNVKQVKVPVPTKEQIQAKLMAIEKAKAKKEAELKRAHTRKVLIIFLAVFGFLFMIALIGVILYVMDPLKLKKKKEMPKEQPIQEAEREVKQEPQNEAEQEVKAQEKQEEKQADKKEAKQEEKIEAKKEPKQKEKQEEKKEPKPEEKIEAEKEVKQQEKQEPKMQEKQEIKLETKEMPKEPAPEETPKGPTPEETPTPANPEETPSPANPEETPAPSTTEEVPPPQAEESPPSQPTV